MVYRGRAGENSYGQKDFDGSIKANDYLVSASSKDGLNWEAGKMLVSSEDDNLRGQVDGPELVYEKSVLKLYYWSFPGVYVMESKDNGKNWSDGKMIIRSIGPDYAPGDTTVVNQNGTWRMYYGLHKRGIFSAKLVK